jgi:hypothetical protein
MKIFSLHLVAFVRWRLVVPMLSHHFRDNNRWSRKMKAKKPLTPRSIDALPAAPKGKRVLTWDATIQGFAVRVTDTGSKSFVLVTRYPGDKHPTPRAIGTVGAISLAKAREKAADWLEAIADGIDPKTLAEEAQANTLRAVAIDRLLLEYSPFRDDSPGKENSHG